MWVQRNVLNARQEPLKVPMGVTGTIKKRGSMGSELHFTKLNVECAEEAEQWGSVRGHRASSHGSMHCRGVLAADVEKTWGQGKVRAPA